MKCTLSIICYCLFFTGVINAQSLAGVTGIKDTSYTTWSAYRNTLKSNPEISVVNEFRFSDVTEQRNIVYCKREKHDLLIDVFAPNRQKNHKKTAVIIVHGGGWRSGNRTQHYPMAQQLAHLGYVCFTPEYRLSTEALYPAAVHDIKAAIKWVKAEALKYGIDTNHIAIAGFSAGGELAAFMAVTGNNPSFEGADSDPAHSAAVNALIDIDGTLSFVHPETGEGNDARGPSAGTYWFGWSKKDNPAIWKEASPLTYVSRNTPPTLFLNSSVDRMHAGRTDYIDALTRYNIYTEVKTFKEAPHSFCLFTPWFSPTIAAIDTFLKKEFK